MARPPLAVNKWDWDLAFVLYCGGMTHDQIRAHEKFLEMPKSTLTTHASKNDWPGRRARLARLPQANAVDSAAKALSERLMTEGISHQEFVLTELERERNVFSRRAKTQDGQMERLQALKLMDDIARKTSKLDEQQPVNPVTQGFAALVYLQTNSRQLENGKSTPLAIMTLPSDQNASEGILRSNNAHVDEVHEADFTQIEEAGPPEGLKAMPKPGSLFGAAPIQPKP